MKIEAIPMVNVPQLDTTKLMARLRKGPMVVPNDEVLLANRSTLYKLGLANNGQITVKKKTLVSRLGSKEVYELTFLPN